MAEWGVGGSSLVGRSAALAEVASLLEERHWSRGGFVLITGPAGMGETRLAEEACAPAVGYRVVWNWCGGPSKGSLHPWPRVVRALAAGNASVSRLARRSAHLSAAGPVGPRPLPLGGEAASGVERRQLFDDVSEILAAAAAEEKFLLVLDDLHDAGPSSLELLAKRHRPSSRTVLSFWPRRATTSSRGGRHPTSEDRWSGTRIASLWVL